MLSMRVKFNLRCLTTQFLGKNAAGVLNYRKYSSGKTNQEKATVNAFSFSDENEEEEIQAREAAIEQKRNHSELFPNDYNKQHGMPPYEKPQFEFQDSLYYSRRLYGKYGERSKFNPSFLWPSEKELQLMKEYEEVAQPFTFQALVAKSQEKKALLKEKIRKEEEEILRKVESIETEIIEFHKRAAVQKQKALLLIEKKNKLIEQVRKHFGYKISVKDTKFQEMLEKLQKEEKKKLKLQKKIAFEEKLKKMNEESQKTKDEKTSDQLEN